MNKLYSYDWEVMGSPRPRWLRHVSAVYYRHFWTGNGDQIAV